MPVFDERTHYTYLNTAVYIPPQADISRPYLPDGDLSAGVQATLDEIKPWEGEQGVVQEFETPQLLGAMVVKVEADESIIWGVNSRHRAKSPGPSPFVDLRDPHDPRRWTHTSTLHLVGPFYRPQLVRAYAGTRIEPLPWMTSANRTKQGLEDSIRFWQNHAYIYRDVLVKERFLIPPAWYEGQS